MKLRSLVLAVLGMVSVGLLACAKPVQKTWTATGGSRSDATIELSYEYIVEREQPVLQESQALELALKRCKAWGYADVEAFGGEVYEDGGEPDLLMGTATRRRVTKTYQCLGQGSETRVKK